MRGLQVVAAGDTNDISSKTCSEPPCLLDRYTRFVPPFDSSVPVGAKQIALKFFFWKNLGKILVVDDRFPTLRLIFAYRLCIWK